MFLFHFMDRIHRMIRRMDGFTAAVLRVVAATLTVAGGLLTLITAAAGRAADALISAAVFAAGTIITVADRCVPD